MKEFTEIVCVAEISRSANGPELFPHEGPHHLCAEYTSYIFQFPEIFIPMSKN
jgi:hypothetical protein